MTMPFSGIAMYLVRPKRMISLGKPVRSAAASELLMCAMHTNMGGRMMNKGTSFLKRFFALVMALALLVSGTNLGAVLRVSAAEAETNVTAGELVANNYELTAEEKALL